MTERLITRPTPTLKDNVTLFVREAAELPLENSQQLLVRKNPLILPSDTDKAILSLPYLDETREEYPYYVNHEGFIIGPHKVGKHAWIVGGQENRVDTIPINANTILIGNILIDPGSHEGIPYLLENLGALGKDLEDIEMVLITHAHLDHIEAIDDLQMLGLVAPVFVPEKSVNQIIHEDAAKIGKDMYQHEFHPFRIDQILTHNDSFDASGYNIIARNGPGHSDDHMYFEFTDEKGHKTFVVGDIIGGADRKQFGSDRSKRKQTLHNLLSEIRDIEVGPDVLEPDDIVAGHHPTAFHKNANFIYEVSRFGTRSMEIVPSQPGMLVSWWA